MVLGPLTVAPGPTETWSPILTLVGYWVRPSGLLTMVALSRTSDLLPILMNPVVESSVA